MKRSTEHLLLWVGGGLALLYFLGSRTTAATYNPATGTWTTAPGGFPATGTGAAPLARYTPTGGTGRIY